MQLFNINRLFLSASAAYTCLFRFLFYHTIITTFPKQQKRTIPSKEIVLSPFYTFIRQAASSLIRILCPWTPTITPPRILLMICTVFPSLTSYCLIWSMISGIPVIHLMVQISPAFVSFNDCIYSPHFLCHVTVSNYSLSIKQTIVFATYLYLNNFNAILHFYTIRRV